MRRELAKAVRDEFASQIKENLPHFHPLKGQRVGSGCYPYYWQPAPELTFFIMLQVSTKADEEFTLEVAYSQNGSFPVHLIAMLPFDFAKTGVGGHAAQEAWRLRVSHLWRSHEKNPDYWWEVTPRPSPQERSKRLRDLAEGRQMDEVPLDEAKKNVEPLVADAINKFIEYGVPYLRSIAKCRGIELKH